MTSAFELDDVPTAELKVLAATAAEHAERGRVRAGAVDEAEETRTGAVVVGRSRLSYMRRAHLRNGRDCAFERNVKPFASKQALTFSYRSPRTSGRAS